MEIVLHLASTEPPEGHATAGDGAEVATFCGWLGLVRVLADLVTDATGPHDGAPARAAPQGGADAGTVAPHPQ